MADQPTQPNESAKKKESITLKELPLHWWNNFVRLPGIRRFRLGRVKVGVREPPLYQELQHWWLEKNKDLWVKNLIPIETKWPAESREMGYGDPDKNEEETILGNREGIVPLYNTLGQYSDIERASIETDWFLSGTGLVIEDMFFQVPDDEKEWERYDWDAEEVRKFKQGISKIVQGRKSYRIKLSPGVVYHEGKKEFKEELYIFGRSNLELISEKIEDINQMFNLEASQAAKIPTEIRTRFGYASAELKKLVTGIQKLEAGAYDKLHKLEGSMTIYRKKSGALVAQLSPERSQIGRIRFPHTFKVIKQYYMQKIIEEIEERDARGKVINRYARKRYVPMYLEYKDIYQEEIDEIRGKLGILKEEINARVQELKRLLIHLKDIIDNPGKFKRAVQEIVNVNRAELKNIIENDELDANDKINKINGIFRHSHAGIEYVLAIRFQDLKFDLTAILSTEKPAEDKINGILELFLNSIKATKLIENELIKKSLDIKKAFTPIRTEEKEEIEKTKDDIYSELRTALVSNYAVINDILKKILKDQESQIRSLIVTGKTAVNLDAVYDRFAKIIIEESKKYENETAGIIGLHESATDMAKNVSFEYRTKTKDFNLRLQEIANITNKDEILKSLKRKKDNFYKRDEELALGLDEYGYPLEIDPKTGEVLIDKWWKELGDNTWQLETIASKAGGADLLRRHLGLTVDMQGKFGARVSGTSTREQRFLVDHRFHTDYDLLETGTMIFGYWDSFRDDQRDGRYHPHSKTVGDYVIEGEGGFDEKLGAPYMKNWLTVSRKFGWYLARRGIFPFSRINLHMSLDEDLIKATPYQFINPKTFENNKEELARLMEARPQWFHSHHNIPSDEDAVKRDYRMKMPDGTWYPPEKNGKKEFNKRSPSKYNPAFDRSAESVPLIFWGNMYYWRWAGYANEWSENPFPHISTRGIAMYIFYLAVSDVWNYEDAIRLLEGATEGYKFDYGVRGQGMFGEVNPASGKNVLQEN